MILLLAVVDQVGMGVCVRWVIRCDIVWGGAYGVIHGEQANRPDHTLLLK